MNGLFATISTSKGEIKIELEFEKTPGTVGNFVGLSLGLINNSIKPLGEAYYNGLKFHRVINDFMIQADALLEPVLVTLGISLMMNFIVS